MTTKQFSIAVLALAVGACHCGKAKTESGGKSAAALTPPDWELYPERYAGTVQVPEKNEITICVGGEPKTIDPQVSFNSIEEPLVRALFEGLVNADARGGAYPPQPGVAEKWEVSDDGKTWTFYLRADSKWVQRNAVGNTRVVGTVTAQDFYYAWARCLNPAFECKYKQMFRDVEIAGVREYMKTSQDAENEKNAAKKATLMAARDAQYAQITRTSFAALDDSTFAVHLDNKSQIFLTKMDFPVFAPVHRPTVEAHPDDWTRPEHIVSNGAFTLASHRKTEAVLTRNPEYWWWPRDQKSGMDKITVVFSEKYDPVFKQYQQGDLHWMGIGALLPEKWVKDHVKSGKPTVQDLHINAAGRMVYVAVNTRVRPFNDARVRQALGFGIDRKRIVERVLQMPYEPLGTFVPLGLGGYTPDFTGFNYDPARARQLLTEAGFPGGQGFPKFTFSHRASDLGRKLAVELQKYWGVLGLIVELAAYEGGQIAERLQAHDFAVSGAGWGMDYADAYTFLGLMVSDSPYNYGYWQDSEFDRLATAGFANMADKPAQLALYRQAEHRLIENAGVIPIFAFTVVQVWAPYLEGIYPNAEDIHPLRYFNIKRN